MTEASKTVSFEEFCVLAPGLFEQDKSQIYLVKVTEDISFYAMDAAYLNKTAERQLDLEKRVTELSKQIDPEDNFGKMH